MIDILIFGHGFVGQHLTRYLQSKTLKVVCLSRAEFNYFNLSLVKTKIQELKPKVVINCSGMTGKPNVDACENEKDKCMIYNSVLPIILELATKECSIPFINISSGCIYTGYEKDYTEEDVPNFGLYTASSSTYSKSKHLAEITLDKKHTTVFRLRMPFCKYNSPRNYLNKLLNYDNLISYKNSMTNLEDFCIFVEKFIVQQYHVTNPGIYNVVNPFALEAKQIVLILKEYGLQNLNWKFVEIENLCLKANRSNCVLSTEKIDKLGLRLPQARQSIELCASALSLQK